MTPLRKCALIALLLALVLAGLSALDARGMRRFRRLQAETTMYEEKRRALAAENDSLRREIAALSGDVKALERAAREDLGLVRSNEVVFTFER